MCGILEADSRSEVPLLNREPNLLRLEPRLHSKVGIFDDDGPGKLSSAGARHDNDHGMALPIGKNGRPEQSTSKTSPFPPLERDPLQKTPIYENERSTLLESTSRWPVLTH